MNKIVMVEDGKINEAPALKLTCTCGFEERAWADRTASIRAEKHIREKHFEGTIVHGDREVLIEYISPRGMVDGS